jgi:hypothetical protein
LTGVGKGRAVAVLHNPITVDGPNSIILADLFQDFVNPSKKGSGDWPCDGLSEITGADGTAF